MPDTKIINEKLKEAQSIINDRNDYRSRCNPCPICYNKMENCSLICTKLRMYNDSNVMTDGMQWMFAYLNGYKLGFFGDLPDDSKATEGA